MPVELTPVERFELAVARWRLEVGEARDIVEAAIDLVGSGVDAPPVLRLAGSMMGGASPDPFELDRLVPASVAAASLPPASRDRMLLVVARDMLERIVDGRVTPYRGASFLFRHGHLPCHGETHFWDTFVYAADEIEDGNPRRTMYERAILDRAREILAAWGPRPALPDRLP
jgi:hypothetical protein